MFETLELQYLNKLVKSKVRDFASPEAFHCVKVQRLGDNRIKPTTQVRRTFIVPISALVGNLAIKSCEFTNSTPPIARTVLLATHGPVEFSELVQGVFQRLRMVDLLTGAQGQIGVHTEVYSYALTCSGHHFFGFTICHNIEPQCSDSIPTDLNILDVPLPLAMVVIQDISADKHKLLFGYTPLLEGDTNSTFGNFRRFIVILRGDFKDLVPCLELRRSVFATLFELRGTDAPATSAVFNPIKEPFIPDMDTDNHSVKGITGYPCPLLMGAFEQLRQMRLQAKTTGVFPIAAVISLLQSKEVVMHIAQVIKHVADAHVLRVFAYLVFVGATHTLLFSLSFFQNGSQSHSLNPFPVGRKPTRHQAVTLEMSVSTVIHILNHNLLRMSSVFSKKNALALHTRADFPPQPKGWGLQSVNFDEFSL